MSILNIEIKAICSDPSNIRDILLSRKADFKGTDHQIDTYFKANHGRFKMREGNIEYSLVHYDREDISGPKRSAVIYYHPRKTDPIKELLSRAIGELVVVDKQREIYYIDNIKFHIDIVKELGSFVEIEAIDKTGEIGAEKLYAQCREYLDLFKIPEEDLLTNSYSDMLLDKEILIRIGTIEEVVELSLQIPEFDYVYAAAEYYKRFKERRSLILIAECDGKPVGFKVGCSTEDHFQSLMGGVLPEFRRKGIADKLAKFQEQWCRENNFTTVRFRTKAKFKNMLFFALSRGFNIISFEDNDFNYLENRILLEKKL
ncbi:MAG: GNAT family N-acetyltransferase [Candidatus Cloacimonadales bacterium]|nr:GNAT family N-acetyltransferase [Candidatus Cloacimonadales bacterium]